MDILHSTTLSSRFINAPLIMSGIPGVRCDRMDFANLQQNLALLTIDY
jgi:hypothetical protein